MHAIILSMDAAPQTSSPLLRRARVRFEPTWWDRLRWDRLRRRRSHEVVYCGSGAVWFDGAGKRAPADLEVTLAERWRKDRER